MKDHDKHLPRSIKMLLELMKKGDVWAEKELTNWCWFNCLSKIEKTVYHIRGNVSESAGLLGQALKIWKQKVKEGKFKLYDDDDLLHGKSICAFLKKIVEFKLKKLIHEEMRKPDKPAKELVTNKFNIAENSEPALDPLELIAKDLAKEMDSTCKIILSGIYNKKLSPTIIGNQLHPPRSAGDVKKMLQQCVDLLLKKLRKELDQTEELYQLSRITRIALDELDDRCRSILKMFYLEEQKFKIKDIAERLNMKENSARTAKYECMKTLNAKIVEKLLAKT